MNRGPKGPAAEDMHSQSGADPRVRGLFPRRSDVDHLARGLEVRRARVSLLPARHRPRHRRAPLRSRDARLADAGPAGLVRRADCDAARPRSGRGLRRCGARGAGVRGRWSHRSRDSGFGIRDSSRRCSSTLPRNGSWFGRANRLSSGPRRLADHRRGNRSRPGIPGSGIRDSGFGTTNHEPSGSRIPIPNPESRRADSRARRHPPAPQRARVRSARSAAARRVSRDARSPAAGRAAVGRHRLAAARAPRPVRPSRAGRDARRLRVPPRPGRAGRMEGRDAPRVPVGTGRVGGPRTCFCSCRSKRGRIAEPAVVRSGHRRGRLLQPRHDRAVRAGAARARRVVLPAAVLGVRPHRPGVVSRGRSGRRAARPASAATTTTPCTTCSASPATRGKACITSRWDCRSKTRG